MKRLRLAFISSVLAGSFALAAGPPVAAAGLTYHFVGKIEEGTRYSVSKEVAHGDGKLAKDGKRSVWQTSPDPTASSWYGPWLTVKKDPATRTQARRHQKACFVMRSKGPRGTKSSVNIRVYARRLHQEQQRVLAKRTVLVDRLKYRRYCLHYDLVGKYRDLQWTVFVNHHGPTRIDRIKLYQGGASSKPSIVDQVRAKPAG